MEFFHRNCIHGTKSLIADCKIEEKTAVPALGKESYEDP